MVMGNKRARCCQRIKPLPVYCIDVNFCNTEYGEYKIFGYVVRASRK